MAVLFLSAIILPFGAGTAFATTNITNGTSNVTNLTINDLTNVTNQSKTVSIVNNTKTTNNTTKALDHLQVTVSLVNRLTLQQVM